MAVIKHASTRNALLFSLALPTLIVVWLVRGARAAWACRHALSTHLKCRHCRERIELVRPWKCSCGYTFLGHLLRKCAVCGSRPQMIRCGQCGMTWKIR